MNRPATLARRLLLAAVALSVASCGDLPETTESARGVISGFNLVLALTVAFVVAAVGLIVAAVGLDRFWTSRRELERREAAPEPEPEEDEEAEIAGIRQGRAGVPKWLYAAYLIIPLWAVAYVFTNVQVVAEAPEQPPGETSPPGPVVQDEWTVVAEDIEFVQDLIVVPPLTDVRIALENLDAGIPHNIAVYQDRTAAVEIFVGEIFNGVETRVYEFTSPDVGEYYFRCDVHPSMEGVFAVEEPGGEEPATPGEQVPPEPPGGEQEAPDEVEITAENIAFTDERITLQTETDVTIVFHNEDAGIPHNVAIYRTNAATEEIFVGEVFNGVATRRYVFAAPPPGEYYFRCDVHPSMEGTAVFE